MALSDDDIDRIVQAMTPKLVSKVREEHHEFWIDGEEHYLAHQWIKEYRDAMTPEEVYDLKMLIRMFRTTRSLWFKAFIGSAIVGTVVMAAVGMGFHK